MLNSMVLLIKLSFIFALEKKWERTIHIGFAMHHTRKICIHHLLFYGVLVFVIKKSFPLQDIFRKPQKMTKVTSGFVCSIMRTCNSAWCIVPLSKYPQFYKTQVIWNTKKKKKERKEIQVFTQYLRICTQPPKNFIQACLSIYLE